MSFTASMLAASYTQGGALSITEIPVPRIRDDEMLLRVGATSICATDVKIVRAGHRKLRDGQQIVLGHEFAGTIAEVGSQVTGFTVGQRVGVVPNAGCGRCDACSRGRANYCPTYTAFGIDRDGSHSPFVRIPGVFIRQGNVVPLPPEISDDQASLLEPFSCVVNSVRESRVVLGDRVVIFGAGPMGLLHAKLFNISGAGKVVMVDPADDRLEQARRLGCDVTINPQHEHLRERVLSATDGQGADVIVTACPIAAVQSEAIQLLAPFGRLCLFGGLPKNSGPVPCDTNAIHYGNFQVTGTTGGSLQDYRIALRLVAGKRIDLGFVVAATLGLSQLREAYDLALAGAAGKVVLTAD